MALFHWRCQTTWTLDQELATPAHSATQNGRFHEAARRAGEGATGPSRPRVREVRTGIWVFNGVFRLLEAWAEQIGAYRYVARSREGVRRPVAGRSQTHREICRSRLHLARSRESLPGNPER